MTRVQRLASEIQNLTHDELVEFRKWFADYDGELWDRQIEADAAAGKFDELAAEALAEFERGETTEL
jgi:predicted nucleic acid-binding protein